MASLINADLLTPVSRATALMRAAKCTGILSDMDTMEPPLVAIRSRNTQGQSIVLHVVKVRATRPSPQTARMSEMMVW